MLRLLKMQVRPCDVNDPTGTKPCEIKESMSILLQSIKTFSVNEACTAILTSWHMHVHDDEAWDPCISFQYCQALADAIINLRCCQCKVAAAISVKMISGS